MKLETSSHDDFFKMRIWLTNQHLLTNILYCIFKTNWKEDFIGERSIFRSVHMYSVIFKRNDKWINISLDKVKSNLVDEKKETLYDWTKTVLIFCVRIYLFIFFGNILNYRFCLDTWNSILWSFLLMFQSFQYPVFVRNNERLFLYKVWRRKYKVY